MSKEKSSQPAAFLFTYQRRICNPAQSGNGFAIQCRLVKELKLFVTKRRRLISSNFSFKMSIGADNISCFFKYVIKVL